MIIPAELLVHSVQVETYLGSGAYGDSYAAATSVQCFADHKRRQVIDTDGNTVLSELTLIMLPGQADKFTPGSRVVYGTTTTHTISAHERDDGGMGAPQHTEVVCQ